MKHQLQSNETVENVGGGALHGERKNAITVLLKIVTASVMEHTLLGHVIDFIFYVFIRNISLLTDENGYLAVSLW